MNWTLKKTLPNLTFETGDDRVSLLPFALYRVHNSPYILGLTPFEIVYVRPPPILPNLRAELLTDFDDQRFLSSLQAQSQVQKQLWPRLREVCEKIPPPCPTGSDQET